MSGPNIAIKNHCDECALASLCFPSSIPKESLFRVTQIITSNLSYNKGQRLYRQGENTQHIHVIKSGSVKTYISNPDGAEYINGFYMTGDIINMESVAAGIHMNSATTLDNSIICKVSFMKLTALKDEFPMLTNMAIRVYSQALALSQDLLKCISKKSASAKLATLLLILNNRQSLQNLDPSRLHLCMSRQDIANYLGLATETLSRAFTRLTDSGCIIKHNRHSDLSIHDRELLQRYASDIEH